MESMNFALARLVHRSWKFKLRALLDGEKRLTDTEILSPEECDLGKWLTTEGLMQRSAVPEVERLIVVHQDLHKAATQVMEFHEAGQFTLAEAAFERVTALSTEIIDLLNTVEREIRS